MADRHTGRCFCGAVEIEAIGEPEEMGYCHCASCRSYTGAPLSGFVLWKAENVRVTRGAELLGGFRKSEMSDRRFCTRCGGHVMTHHPTLSITDVYAGVLPGIAFLPVVHLTTPKPSFPSRMASRSKETSLPRWADRARSWPRRLSGVCVHGTV